MTTPTPLAKLTFFFLFLLSFNAYAQVPTNADCLGAIPVCQTVYSFNSSVHGIGNYADIPVMGSANEDHCPGNCISAGEQNTTWFIFTTQTAGLLNFTISPVSGSDDYDWAVFNMTTNGCSDIYSGGMQVSCNYCLNTGSTGPNGGTGYACWGPNSCSQYNAPIPVGANQTYVLMVDNFSSSNNGYTLDFSASSAQIFDNVPPTLSTLQTPVNCGASTLNINFSENILCSSISPSDFTVTGPGGPYTVTYVSGAACNVGGTLENSYALTVVPNMSGSGTYTLSLTNASGSVTDACANVAPTRNINFTINGPNVSVTPSTPSYCGSGSVNMTASGATSYLWSPSTGLSSTSSATVTASPSATTTYTIFGSTAGCTDVETATVTVNPSPVVSFSQSPAGAQCTGTSVTVTANSNIPGSSFVWSSGGNTASITVTPATTTTYTVTATSPLSCTSTASYTVTINPLPVVNLTPFTAVCANGSSFTLSNGSPAGGTYSGTGVSGGTFNPAVSGAGVFPITYTYTNGNGCTNSDVENITVNSAPVVSFAALNQVCINTPSFAITGGSPAGGVYSGTGVSGGNFNPATAGAGTHTITYTYTNGSGCTGSATQTITVNALPVVSLSPFTAVCTNTPAFALSGGSPAGGVYSGTGVSAGNFNPATAGAGTHTITYTYTNASSCTNSTTQNITVNTPPTATFTVAPLNGCDMVPVTATYSGNGGSGATYNWDFDGGTANPGSGAGPHSITFPSQGSYDVSLTVTENGCTSAPYQVTVAIGGVDATAAVVHDALCYSQSNGEATVNINGGTSPFSYAWNTTPAQLTQNAINLAAGSYIVTVTDDHGCTDVDSVTINEPPVLLAHIADSSIVSCFGGSDGMDSLAVSGGTPPYYYAWASSTSSSPYATGYSAGVYTVTVTDDKGCNVIVPFMVYQNPQIQISIDAVNEGCESSCTGSANATVTGGISPYTYLWSLGAASTQGINNLCAGDYTLSVTDAINCTLTETVNIATNTFIHADGSAAPVEGQGPLTVNFFFTGSGASDYNWDFGDGIGTSGDVNPSYTYTHEGVYTVVLTVNSGNPDHCSDTYTVQITVHAPSVIEIPNVFTPNNDLTNDVFTVKSEGLQTEKMVIYNRWGKEVYEWNEVHGKWDGIARSGQQASDGEYYFIFDAAGYDGQEYHVSGSVTLIR
jgi:gliding motility-associated-like protein